MEGSGNSQGPEEYGHVPVMADAVLEWLAVEPDGTYIDCTAGAGGHAARIARALQGGRLIALDRDPYAAHLAARRLSVFRQCTVLHRTYGELAAVLKTLEVESVHGVLIDAGLSSMQLNTPGRGFSFQEEGPLDMRFDTESGPTAEQYLATVDEAELARVFREYGDVGPSRRIASAIRRRACAGQMRTTRDLASAVSEALPFTTAPPEEVRTVFQAIRIAVNDELQWFEKGMREAIDALRPNGRLVVLTFHSGEDRVAKNLFRQAGHPVRETRPDGRLIRIHPATVEVLTPKPILPTESEMRANSRARSAKLRAVRKRSLEGCKEERGHVDGHTS